MNRSRVSLSMVPVYGIAIFFVLYVAAAFLYPGGSQADHNEPGFSWINNYWCDLLSEEGYNGIKNNGRPVAAAAMLIVCASLAIFYYTFPKSNIYRKYERVTIQVTGILAMAVALFLSSQFHDQVIYISSGFGLIALAGTFIGLRRFQWRFLFWFGIVNLAIFFIDHYIYYSRWMIEFLPLIQKINFASLLIWYAMIAYRSNWRHDSSHPKTSD